MAHYAQRCLCGHQGCRDWHVSPSAAMQGVSFTREEAEAVAETLNELHGIADEETPRVKYLDITGGKAVIVDGEGQRYTLDVSAGVRALAATHLEEVNAQRKVDIKRLSVPLQHEVGPKVDIDEARWTELDRHGVAMRGRGGPWGGNATDKIEIYAVPARLAIADPNAEWVIEAVRKPDLEIAHIISEMARRSTLATRALARQIWNDPDARKSAMRQAGADADTTLVVKVHGGRVNDIIFPGGGDGADINVRVEDYDTEGMEESKLSPGTDSEHSCGVTMWHGYQTRREDGK